MNKHEKSTRFADRSTKAAREIMERGMRSAEEATNGAKLNLLSSFAGMRELNTKLIEMAHANADAVFDLAHEIASAEAPSDLMAIWSAYAKRRFEMMTNQTKELTEVGQKWQAGTPSRRHSQVAWRGLMGLALWAEGQHTLACRSEVPDEFGNEQPGLLAE